jgi:hypothetical protein
MHGNAVKLSSETPFQRRASMTMTRGAGSLLAVLAIVQAISCAGLPKKLIGKWINADWTIEFRADGTFSSERGILGSKGTYAWDGPDRLRMEYQGVKGALGGLVETFTGPKPTVLTVQIKGDFLLLTRGDATVEIYRRIGS